MHISLIIYIPLDSQTYFCSFNFISLNIDIIFRPTFYSNVKQQNYIVFTKGKASF